MTALDIAGAVVSTPLALLFWAEFVVRASYGCVCAAEFVLIVATVLSVASVYCIARLFGAAP